MKQKYVKELHKEMEEDFNLNSRVDKYEKEIESRYSEIYCERMNEKRKVKWAIMTPTLCLLSCVVGVGATFGILNASGKIIDQNVSANTEDYLLKYNDFLSDKNYEKVAKIPESSYFIGNNTNMYVYSALKSDGTLDYICQIYTKKSLNKVTIRLTNPQEQVKNICKEKSENNIIEIINDDNFTVDESLLFASVIFDENSEYNIDLEIHLYSILK